MQEHSSPAALFDAARAIVLAERDASKSLLQRRLKIGFASAVDLVEKLHSIGIVSPANPANYRIVAQVEPVLARHSHEQRLVRSLRDLALTFVECSEEGIQPHSLVTSLCLDRHEIKMSHTQAGSAARRVLLAPGSSPVLDVALAIGALTDLAQGEAWVHIERELRQVCSLVDRPYTPVSDGYDKVCRAYTRALRYLERRILDGEDPHTRVWDAFIPMAYIPQGKERGAVDTTHPEHVVPCKVLAVEATRLLRGGLSFQVVQSWIQPYLVVVWIAQDQAHRLDKGSHRHLQYAMPDGWQFGVGCLYARLHEIGLVFDAPEQAPCVESCRGTDSA